MQRCPFSFDLGNMPTVTFDDKEFYKDDISDDKLEKPAKTLEVRNRAVTRIHSNDDFDLAGQMAVSSVVSESERFGQAACRFVQLFRQC